MKTLRFKVGDVCEIIAAGAGGKDWRGEIVTILAGPIECLAPGCQVPSYRIARGFVHETSLRKLPGDSHIHADTLKLFDQKPNTDLPVGPKVKERV
jgi:hypothetical protein